MTVHTIEPTSGPTRDVVAGYFAAIAPWLACYKGLSLAFLGVKIDGTVLVYRARLRLTLINPKDQMTFETGPYVGGRLPLHKFGVSAEECVLRLASGKAVSTQHGLTLALPGDETATLHVEPPELLHPEGLQTGRRLSVITLVGGEPAGDVMSAEADWQLKAGKFPFDGVTDALVSLGLGAQRANRCSLDVVADAPIEVLVDSHVKGTNADLGVWLAPGLRRSAARLTYRVFDKGNCINRGALSGRNLTWTRRGDVAIGRGQIEVPAAAIVSCVAVYADCAHNTLWVGDAQNFQNPRLAALDTVDKGQQLLRGYLLPNEAKGAAQYQFESAVAWMLWALGLSVVQTDRADQAKEGPDIIAVSPNGGQMLVECTIGLLKTESKLAKIARRAVDVRDRLRSVGATGTTVIPIIVTALARDKVASELDAAVEAGVLVVAREELESSLTQMLLFPDGERVFRAAHESLRAAQATLQRKRETALPH